MRYAIVVAIAMSFGCRQAYPAGPARTVAAISPSQFGRTDTGDVPSVRGAERACEAGLSSRAVSAAFRAVDEVADAVSDLCSIEIVDDDPLVWHVWCGSDAMFQSGHYLAPADGVACEGGRAQTAFECIGRILARHLLASEMAAHVQGVEIVSIGSVDGQRIAPDSAFLTDPCTDLEAQGVAERWDPPQSPPSENEREGVWNTRLSWCRAAFSAQQLHTGMSRAIVSRYTLGAIGAGTDWLDHWRQTARTPCPTPARVSNEHQRGQCRDARRVDVFVRVKAREGSERPASCRAPGELGESGQALYCWSDCQAHAAIGRNSEGYQAPRSRDDLLFGGASAAPQGWIVDRGSGARAVNTASVRQLLLR